MATPLICSRQPVCNCTIFAGAVQEPCAVNLSCSAPTDVVTCSPDGGARFPVTEHWSVLLIAPFHDAMGKIVYRRATPEDYPSILALHHSNLRDILTEAQRKDGFLSMPVTVEQIAAANEDLAVIVADRDGSILGELFATTNEQAAQFPLLRRMMELYDTTLFMGKPLSEYRTFLYGPVCVAREARGTGVLESLFREMLRHFAGRYEVGTLFIDKMNERSIQAHTRKLGMQVLRPFDFAGRSYLLLAFAVPAQH